MKIVFFGTTDFAVASLEALIHSSHEVVAVVTNIDTFGGRGRKEIIKSAVSLFSEEHHIPTLKPKSLKSSKFIATLAEYKADIFVVVAFRMLPEMVWSLPPKGSINVHGSLLPAYRGAAPINWAIIKGEAVTGVSIFQLDHAIDTGNILLQKNIPIDENDDFGSLYNKLKILGSETLIEALYKIETHQVKNSPQVDALASHAPKLNRDNTKISFSDNAINIMNLCRGLNPYPGAWLEWDGKIIKIWKALPSETKLQPNEWHTDYKSFLEIGCIDGSVTIIELQPEGKKKMSTKEYLNGVSQKLKQIALDKRFIE